MEIEGFMIILEGVDKSGKSTLAQKILDWYPELTLKKFGIPKGNPIPEYIDELLRYHNNVLYDRFIYGEVPYSIVKKRERFMRSFELTMLDLMVQSYPHLVIYVCPDRQTIFDRLAKEPDNYVNSTDILQLIEEYDNVFSFITSKTVFYVSPRADDKLKEYIATYACNVNKHARFQYWKHNCSPGIGTLDPYYLFVGERYNPNAEFQVTFWSGAGEYLLQMMRYAEIKLDLCHFTNAFTSNTGITEEQINFFNAKKIIALGSIASDRLKELGIEHTKIYHPAFWLRFKSGKELLYIKQLEDACKL